MGYWNDNSAFIDAKGGLTLGKSRSDAPIGGSDGAFDATYGYAKSDCFIPVPPNTVLVAAGATGVWTTPTSIARAASNGAGLPAAITLATANTAYFLQVPVAQLVRTYLPDPHGFLLKGIAFGYSVASTVLTAPPTVVFFHEVTANAGARANTAVPGTVTYENPPGTVVAAASVPVALQATPYLTRANVGTPTWITAASDILYAEIAIATGITSGTAQVTGIELFGSLAIY